jgi:multidrug resistance protein MdtO
MQKTWLRIGGALLATLLALLLIVFVQPWTDSLSGLLAMTLPVLALAAWIAAGSERIAYAGIQIGFHLCAGLPQLVWPADNLTELRDRVLGILLGVLVSSIVHLYLWPDSEAPQLKSRLADSIAGWRTASPPRTMRCRWPAVCRLHRQRSAYPSGSRRTAGHVCPPGPRRKLADARHLAQAEEIARLSEGYRLNAAPGDPTWPAAPNSCGATPNVSNRRQRRLPNRWPPT